MARFVKSSGAPTQSEPKFLAPDVQPSRFVVTDDPKQTNALLARLCLAVERIADYLAPPVAEQIPQSEAEADDNPLVDEETLAIIEMMEDSGRTVPDEVYRRLGIDP